MNCVVIGYGSIGSRHARILKGLGHTVHVVTKRDVKGFACYKSLKGALQNTDFDYVIISNETYKHYDSFVELSQLGHSGKHFIEKPAFLEPCLLPQTEFENVFIGYNLRFHPIIQQIRQFLMDKEIYSIQIYVGQYLPTWRCCSDYTKSYSASRDMGGGVLRDLSHELDYMNWIAGGWKRVSAIGGKFGTLQIDSDDVFVLLLEMERCPVATVQMNYLDRMGRREIIINLKDHSIKADLINSTLEIDGKMTTFEVERDLTYTIQHKAILSGYHDDVCTMEQGMDVLKLICAAESASENGIWVSK